jgi:hypothetical protein
MYAEPDWRSQVLRSRGTCQLAPPPQRCRVDAIPCHPGSSIASPQHFSLRNNRRPTFDRRTRRSLGLGTPASNIPLEPPLRDCLCSVFPDPSEISDRSDRSRGKQSEVSPATTRLRANIELELQNERVRTPYTFADKLPLPSSYPPFPPLLSFNQKYV